MSSSLPTPLTSEATQKAQLPGISIPVQSRTAPQIRPSFLFARPSDEQVKQCRIMIVDDEESVARTVRTFLKQAGFENFIVETEANNTITQLRKHQPDLLLLDLKMPVNGLQILETIRRDDAIHHIPVIIFTSDTNANTRIEALTLGADDFLTKPVDVSELVARVRNTLAGKVVRDQLASYSMALESNVLLDELTNIANRRAFDYELSRRLIEWKRQRTPLSLMMIDIDYFKRVNDELGHPIGDLVLKDVARTLEICVREMDLVARMGGEEFAVIMPNTLASEARLAAERIRMTFANRSMQFGSHNVQITVSIGLATSMNGDDGKLLVQRADQALYESKRQGRNRSCFHDGSKLDLVTDLSRNQAANEPSRTTETDSPSDEQEGVYQGLKKSQIIAIDDEPSTSLMVRKLLKKNGYENVLTENNSTKAFQLIKDSMPDLVLLDIQMPEVDGIQILTQLRSDYETKHLPVIILTSATEYDIKVKALGLGANDVLHKPVHESEMLARVKNTLLAKAHSDQLANYSARLEHDVRLRTAELMASRREAIECLARAAEIRDDATGKHILRVGRYAAVIAEELGFDRERVTWIEHAAQLHDVGKIGIPDSILNKPGKLTDQEYDFMKRHCELGKNIIRDASHKDELDISLDPIGADNHFLDDCNSPIMRTAAIVAATHHEKWDGSGYPLGLKGEKIPIEGRITAVADVFDALSTKRCYKEAISLDECFQIIRDSAGTHFDPAVVRAFERRRFDIIDIYNTYSDRA